MKFGVHHPKIREKQQLYYYIVSYVQCRSKTQIYAEGGIFEIFIDLFRNPYIWHVACHILSQICVAKILRPFQAVIIFFTLDLEYCSKTYWKYILQKVQLKPGKITLHKKTKCYSPQKNNEC